MFFARDGVLLGIISVADPIRPTSADAIRALREAGLKTVLLTGDSQAAARHIAAQAGIDQVIAEVLPADKAGVVERLQKSGEIVMETELLFDVPPSCFCPAPKVTSSVLRCVRRPAPAVTVADEAFFFRTIRGAFALRRKTLVNSLSHSLNFSREAVADAVAACGLPPDVRGERLTLQDFAQLSEILLTAQK